MIAFFGIMEQIRIADIGDIKIRRGEHIKFLSIRMAPGRGVWVNVPFGVSQKQVEKFIGEKRAWIIENMSRVKVYEKDTGVGLGIGAEVKTKLHVLKIEECEAAKPGYKLTGHVITLFIPKGTDYARIEKMVQNFLLQIYKTECSRFLPERVRHYAGKFGFKFTRLSFRNNVSNWGSCSHDNNISLNIKLMKLPDEIIDYVILHELCHTVEKNHSDKFWKLVRSVCPDFEKRRRELRNYNTRV